MAHRWEVGETLLKQATALVERDPDAAAIRSPADRSRLKQPRPISMATASLIELLSQSA